MRAWFIFTRWPVQIGLAAKDDGCVGGICWLSCACSVIVLLWTSGKTVWRSESKPRLMVGRVAQSFWSSARHIWAKDVVVMLRLWWSDPRRRRRRRKVFGKDDYTSRKDLRCLHRGPIKTEPAHNLSHHCRLRRSRPFLVYFCPVFSSMFVPSVFLLRQSPTSTFTAAFS